MADYDLGTLSRKILVIVAILSCLVIAEMILPRMLPSMPS
jgi:hypothetical protein